jgi:hypothetical protein
MFDLVGYKKKCEQQMDRLVDPRAIFMLINHCIIGKPLVFFVVKWEENRGRQLLHCRQVWKKCPLSGAYLAPCMWAMPLFFIQMEDSSTCNNVLVACYMCLIPPFLGFPYRQCIYGVT